MLNSCDECKHHGLTVDDVEKGEANEDDSDSDSETNMVRYYQWKRGGDDGYLTKLIVEADDDETLGLWHSMVEALKEYIHYNRRQLKDTRRITDSLPMEEILIRIDYSENYKSKHQKEIQSAYFGNKFGAYFGNLFTACTYYQNGKLPITITTEESDKSRVTPLLCVSKGVTNSLEKLNQQIKTVYIASDGCALQFRSRYIFSLLMHIHPDITIE